MRGRPGYRRYVDPSNFLAMSFLCQPRMVSGLTMVPMFLRAVFPNRLPNAPNVFRDQIFVPQQQVLVNRSAEIGESCFPFHSASPWL